MSLFDSLFGGGLAQYTQPQQMPGQYTNAQMNTSIAAQQLQFFNNAGWNSQPRTKWMIHGEACANVQEFAKKLYPEDPAQQMMLILRLGE